MNSYQFAQQNSENYIMIDMYFPDCAADCPSSPSRSVWSRLCRRAPPAMTSHSKPCRFPAHGQWPMQELHESSLISMSSVHSIISTKIAIALGSCFYLWSYLFQLPEVLQSFFVFSPLQSVAPPMVLVALQGFSALLNSREDLVVVENYSIDVELSPKSIAMALTEMAERGFKARTTVHFMSSRLHANCLLARRRISSIIFASEAFPPYFHALTLSVANACLHFDNIQIVKLVLYPTEIIDVMRVAKDIGLDIKEFTWLSIYEPTWDLVGFSCLLDGLWYCTYISATPRSYLRMHTSA